MPQALSKFEQPSNQSLLTLTDKVQKRHIPSKWNKFQYRKKTHKKAFPPISSIAPHQLPKDCEDWDKEIEELSCSLEKVKEMKDETPYGPKEELKVTLNELTLYKVPEAPTPNQDHYSPSMHHVPPVKWVHYICSHEVGQFTDAEE